MGGQIVHCDGVARMIGMSDGHGPRRLVRMAVQRLIIALVDITMCALDMLTSLREHVGYDVRDHIGWCDIILEIASVVVCF